MAFRNRLATGLLVAALGAPGLLLGSAAPASAQGWRYSRFGYDNASQVVRRAYLDILGREPDPAGMAAYRRHMMVDGWSESDVRRALYRSDERRSAYGYGNGNGYGSFYNRAGFYGGNYAQQIVRQAYRDVLRREPDAAGYHDYGLRVTRDGWSLGDVERALRNSPEYRVKFGY